MSTRYGIGGELDFTLQAGANANTTTSQYKVCYLSAANTANPVQSTATARTSFGVIQSYQSAGSADVTVRHDGISKVFCGSAVTAGQWVRAYEGISTTTHYGDVEAVATGVSISVATASISAHSNLLGIAIESGVTNQAISILLKPNLYDAQLIA